MKEHSALKPDGERFLPQFRGIIELEHYHRYFLALQLVEAKDVLDIASGEGFGSEILSRHARSVVGVDISPEAVAHASAHYVRENLQFLQGSATGIPLPDRSVDVIVSFETIEHLAEHDAMMSELKRVLRADGCLIISSPNKLVYTDRANYTNPFHVRELYTPDFLRLTSRYFSHTRHYGQRVTTGSVIASAESAAPFTTYAPADLAKGVPDQMYDIILASDVELLELGSSIFEQPYGPLQPQKIESLAAEVEARGAKVERLEHEVGARDAAVERLEREVGARDAAVERLEHEVGARGAAVERLEHEVKARGAAVERLEREVKARGAEVERLEREVGARDAAVERLEHEVGAQVSSVARLEFEVASLGEQANSIRSAFYQAMRDGQLLVQDKWWRRTKGLRKLSNSIRKWKGKPPRTWPTSFEAERYVAVSDGHIRAPIGQPVAPLDQYDPSIPRVVYSDVSEEFVPYQASDAMQTVPRAIAFYLPQFHPFPENDTWWGKGFTEWTNVGKARPMFQGHHQPHCPIHLGYYDLRVPEVMEEQARLAKEYGISGFAYYFYWFAGKVLMDRPLKQMLGNPKVDIPFCMIWANENWTRRWDGLDQDVLIAQEHSIQDSRAMVDYLRPFMKDPRYIKVDGKPLFIVYRADIIPEMKATIIAWRKQAEEFGFPGLYVVCAQTFGQRDPHKYGFDAAMEFPPHTVNSHEVSDRLKSIDPAFNGSVFSYDQVVTNAVMRHDDEFKVFPTAMLSWDNTARKKKDSHIFTDFSLVRYAQWLSSNAERVTKDSRLSADENLIFINAWNEWAEGTHLEPDQKYGYGYLEATRSVMKNYEVEGAPFQHPKLPASSGSEIALIVHLHYEDTWPDLRDAIERIEGYKPDIFVTVTSLRLAKLVEADFPTAVIELVDNRGRDIRPFLLMLERTRRFGYKAVAKIHGKASLYRTDGNRLRQDALHGLLTTDTVEFLKKHPQIGVLALKDSLLSHAIEDYMSNNLDNVTNIAAELGLESWRGRFPAGSMFWFRPDALAPLLRLSLNDFDIERGLADGTRAHAIERLFCSVCESTGYEVATRGGDPNEEPDNRKKIDVGDDISGSSVPMSPLEQWHVRMLRQSDGEIDPALPRLPPRAIQEQFVGSAMRPAFEEAYAFYTTFEGYANSLGMPMQAEDSRFLDFGCGWGRFLRYAMHQFPQERLFATDIDPDIIKICVDSGIPAQFKLLEPFGKLPFPDGFFSHVMAYSVFTHLPEDVHLNWSAEIIRVLKPGGVFCGTIETRKFLEFIQNMPESDDHPNEWRRALSQYKPQTAELLSDYDSGKFVYLPTGGGGVRTNDVYGEAVISPAYIEKKWQGVSLRAVLDEQFWQTVFIVQKA